MQAQPVHGFFVRVHGFQRVHLRIADDAQRMRAGRQRDQPEPVTGPAHVIGGTPAIRRRAALQPAAVLRPTVRVDQAFHAPPHRIGVVRVVLCQAQLALEQAGAATGIDHPARAQRALLAGMFVAHRVVGLVFGQIHALDAAVVQERDALRAGALTEEIFEAAAVDLPRRCRQDLADAQLGAAVDVFAFVGEEEAETELADLLGLQMLAQAQHVGKIMRADLHRGFTHLERSLAHRVRTALQHGDRKLRIALLQLQGQAQAGQTTTGDDDIATLCIHGDGLLLVAAGTVANSPSTSSMITGLARTLRYSRQMCP